MSGTYCKHVIRIGVYYTIAFNFVGGLSQLIKGISYFLSKKSHSNYPIFYITGGLFVIFCGILLMIGSIKENYKYILIYLILTIPGLLCVTIYSGMMIYLPEFVFLFVTLLVLVWPMYYCVYLFYKKLLKKHNYILSLEKGMQMTST
ncbi:uncharacterized protein LOC123008669 [Tribolium madens]|uniref:uncharacterized protein LOC123008669 n=1 Tax=Tribolium madens TaxID=41895 RepID=UPI001CF766E9|nr:uncharacterized protein LOC123008669 [Tribolium madens]